MATPSFTPFIPHIVSLSLCVPGTITRVITTTTDNNDDNDDDSDNSVTTTYDIAYDDGDEEVGVKREMIKLQMVERDEMGEVDGNMIADGDGGDGGDGGEMVEHEEKVDVLMMMGEGGIEAEAEGLEGEDSDERWGEVLHTVASVMREVTRTRTDDGQMTDETMMMMMEEGEGEEMVESVENGNEDDEANEGEKKENDEDVADDVIDMDDDDEEITRMVKEMLATAQITREVGGVGEGCTDNLTNACVNSANLPPEHDEEQEQDQEQEDEEPMVVNMRDEWSKPTTKRTKPVVKCPCGRPCPTPTNTGKLTHHDHHMNTSTRILLIIVINTIRSMSSDIN